MEHSKIPWKQSKNIVLVDGYPGYLARCLVWDGDTGTAHANAEFIVKACNEHDTLKAKADLFDELVEDCEGVLDFLEYRKDDLKHLGETEVRRQILRRVLAKCKEIKK